MTNFAQNGEAAPRTPPRHEGAPPEPRALSARAFFGALRAAAPTALLAALYLWLCFMLFQNARAAGQGGAALSLRYTVPLPAAAAASARFANANPDTELALSGTYWYQSAPQNYTTSRGSAEAVTLFADGEFSAAAREEFLFGNYPGVLEKRGIALSEALSWTLFGGADVVGSALEWDGKTYTVCGVFAGDLPLALIQTDAAAPPSALEGFTGVELSGPVEGDPREAARAWASGVGLGAPELILNNKTLPGIMAAMAWLPAAALLLWFFARLLGLLRRAPYWARQAVCFALLIGAALLLPRALSLLPGWMIPTRWSDFEHWREFMKEMNARITEWLSLSPYMGDVQLKRRLIVQVLLLIPALLAMVAVIVRANGHISRAAAAPAPAPAGGDDEADAGAPEDGVDSGAGGPAVRGLARGGPAGGGPAGERQAKAAPGTGGAKSAGRAEEADGADDTDDIALLRQSAAGQKKMGSGS